MSAIPTYYWPGFPLADKFAWINGSPGLGAVDGSARSVGGMGKTLQETTEGSGRAMRALGVSWTGPASAAAQRSTAGTVRGAARSAHLAANGADRILDYGHSYEAMRQNVHYDDPSQYSWVQRIGDVDSELAHRAWGTVWGTGDDHVSIAEWNDRYAAAADQALMRHNQAAQQADDGFVLDGGDPRAAAGATPGGPGAGTTGTGGGATPHVAPASVTPTPGTPAGAAGGTAGPAPAAGTAPSGSGATPPPVPGTGPAGTRNDGTTGGAAGTGGTGSTGGNGFRGGTGSTTPAALDPTRTPGELGDQFGRDLSKGSLGGLGGGGGTVGDRYGAGGRSGQFGGWSGGDPTDPLLGGGTGTRTGPGEGGRLRGTPWGEGGRTSEPVVTGRAAGTGLGSGYAPMMGAGGARQDGTPHRNRYLLPSSAPFDVDVPHTPAVLGPDEDGGD